MAKKFYQFRTSDFRLFFKGLNEYGKRLETGDLDEIQSAGTFYGIQARLALLGAYQLAAHLIPVAIALRASGADKLVERLF